MAQSENLINATARHSIYLEGLKAGEANKIAPFIKQMDAVLRSRLSTDGRSLKLIAEINKELKIIFGEYTELTTDNLRDIAEYEAGFEGRSLDKIGVDTVMPPPAQIHAAVFASPLSVRGAGGGKLLDPFISDWAVSDRKLLTGIIRQGFAEGRTNSQILRDIRGTAKAKFNDGALATVDRHGRAIVRTSVQHTASVARAKVWDDNKDIIKGYRWLSTLDSRTSSQCRALDGTLFKVGKGPMPPIHISCRSSTTAELDDRYSFLSEDSTRASKDGPVDASETYYGFLAKQNADFQDSVIGPTLGKVLRDGDLSETRFARMQLDRQFNPLTIKEMEKLEPLAFKKAGIT